MEHDLVADRGICASGRGRLRAVVGIVNLDGRGMLVVSVARRLGSEGPLLAYCVAPALTERAAKRRPGSAKLTKPAHLPRHAGQWGAGRYLVIPRWVVRGQPARGRVDLGGTAGLDRGGGI